MSVCFVYLNFCWIHIIHSHEKSTSGSSEKTHKTLVYEQSHIWGYVSTPNNTRYYYYKLISFLCFCMENVRLWLDIAGKHTYNKQTYNRL